MPPQNDTSSTGSSRRASRFYDDKSLSDIHLEKDEFGRPHSKSNAERIKYEKEQAALASDPTIIRVAGPVPSAAWFIIACELCERFSFYGASLIFQTYMLGELGLPKSQATALNRGFVFLCYFTSILGAIIADVWWGKFKTIIVFAVCYMIGLILLTASSTTASIAAGFGLSGFILATYVFIASGTGGIKANVSAFAAEQVKEGIHPTATAGVYEDSRLTVETVFRFFYWAINMGALVGQVICPTVSHHSFPIAFMIPAVVFVLGIAVFALGRRRYIARPPNGTVLGKVVRCMRYAVSHRGANPGAQHWLDNAKVAQGHGWDARFVEDLKRTLKACTVFLFYPVYWALYGNMADNFINQGINMVRPAWLGPEQLNALNSLVIVVAIPIFDRLVFPLLRKMGFRLGPITRITIGFIICGLCFVYGTVLQHVLYQTGPYYDFQNVPKGIIPVNDISVFWQMPLYTVIAISEIFASVTGLEFAFSQAAPELKSIVMALFLLTSCGGSLIGMALAPWSIDPHFVTLFAVQTVLMFAVTVVFWFLFRKLDDEQSVVANE